MVRGDLWYLFSKLSYWNDTTCIRSDNIELIEQTLIHIFEKEGYRLISKPPLPQNPQPLIQELRSSPWKIEPYLWVISLAVGNLGWTIVKSSVIELLCRRTKGNNRPRLLELSMRTGYDVFHNCVDDRHWGVLLEAKASGQTFASGYLDCYDVEGIMFYGKTVTEPRRRQNFFLLNVPKELQTAGTVEVHLSKEEKQRRQQELEALYQQGGKEQIEKAMAEWKELTMGGCERLDEALGHLLCHSHSYWHENNVLCKAYTEPQKLEADGVRLLFFQVGRFDHRPNREEIWNPITNFEWENFTADMVRIGLGKSFWYNF